MTVERETSLRRVLEVLRHPSVAPHIPAARREDFIPPVGKDVLYLKVGDSFMAYFLRGDVAEVHGCLLPEDRGPQATVAIKEQFEHVFGLGVKQIFGVPRNARAEAKARAVGMQDTGKTVDGFKVYEVSK